MSISQRILDRWNAMAKAKGQFDDDVYSTPDEREVFAKEEDTEDTSLEVAEKAPSESSITDTSSTDTSTDTSETEEKKYDNPFSGGFYSTLYDKLNPDLLPETPEEAALRERRDRSRSTISAISDGLAGIANMFGVTGGAENIQLSSLSDVNKQRMDKAQELRDRYRDAYARGKMQAEIMDRQEKLGAEKEAKADARYEDETAYKREQDAKAQERQKEQDELTKRRVEQGIIQSEELHPGNLELQKLSIEAKEAQIRASNAAASAALAKGAGIKEGPTTKFKSYSLSDDQIVDIPEAIHDSYIADVYNFMVKQSGLDGEAFDKLLLESDLGVNDSSSSKMRAAVIRLAAKYTGVEDYMKTRATELNDAYARHLNPESVTQITPYGGASKGFVPTPENTTGSTGKDSTDTKNGSGIDPKIKEQINKEQAEKEAEQILDELEKYGGTVIDVENLTPEEHEAYEQAILNKNKK